MGERFPDAEEVVGSSPAAPIHPSTNHGSGTRANASMSQLQIKIANQTHHVSDHMRVGELLAQAAPAWLEVGIGVRLGEHVLDFQMLFKGSGDLELISTELNPAAALEMTRHTASHVMAQAVQQLFGDTQVGIGPPTDSGFYYDFLREEPFTPEDLEKIESRMQELITADQPMQRLEMSREEALELFEKKDEFLKCELIRDKGGELVSCYQQGEFIDFCTGPHLPSSVHIPAVKVLHSAAAHWRGRDDAPMMQRIYATAFFSEEDLEGHLDQLEEIRRRDHRRLGADLDLYHIDESAGPGMVFWHPKGALIRSVIEDYLRAEHLRRGYELVYTPHIAHRKLWEKSGHWDYYRDNMYSLEIDEQEYVLKPMNCPGHILVYQTRGRSYRELPVRLAEFGTVYRYERSGVLHGMLRARGFTQDDAHLFCTPEQIDEEILGALQFMRDLLATFGFEEYTVELSVRDAENTSKYAGSDTDWERAEEGLTRALNAEGLDYTRMEGEAVFYGPKIDVQVTDAIGRKWQCSTVQFDFTLPERFEIGFVGSDSREHRVIMIHRALLGSFERFFGMLVEHYAGAFPLWLAPVQATVIPIADRHGDYAQQIAEEARERGLRVSLDGRSEKMGAKIRDAQMQKIPFMLVVGDREVEARQIAVRHRTAGNLGSMLTSDFIDRTVADVEARALQEWPVEPD